MRVVWLVSDDKTGKIKDIIYGDDYLARLSVVFRGAQILGFKKQGTYLYVEGDEKIIQKLEGLVKGMVEKVSEKEAADVIRKINEADESAAVGLGSIFG